MLVLWPRAAEQQGQAQEQAQGEVVVDDNMLPYCSIDGKKKRTIEKTGADEQNLLEASMAYIGNPIMPDVEFDELKLRLKQDGSHIGRRCSLRSRKVACLHVERNMLVEGDVA